jgi:hypothetical protein
MITRLFCSRSGRVDRLLRKAFGDTDKGDQATLTTSRRKNRVSKFSLKGLRMDDSMYDTSRPEVTVRQFKKRIGTSKELGQPVPDVHGETIVKVVPKASSIQEYLLKDDLDDVTTVAASESKNSWPKRYFPRHFIKQ